MPVVPITSGKRKGQAQALPSRPLPEPFALMAAAQMHSEGRLNPDPDLPPQLGGKEPT